MCTHIDKKNSLALEALEFYALNKSSVNVLKRDLFNVMNILANYNEYMRTALNVSAVFVLTMSRIIYAGFAERFKYQCKVFSRYIYCSVLPSSE